MVKRRACRPALQHDKINGLPKRRRPISMQEQSIIPSVARAQRNGRTARPNAERERERDERDCDIIRIKVSTSTAVVLDRDIVCFPRACVGGTSLANTSSINELSAIHHLAVEVAGRRERAREKDRALKEGWLCVQQDTGRHPSFG